MGQVNVKSAVVIEQETLDAEKAASNKINQDYLNSTDWMIIRKSDIGVAVPKSVKKARSDARHAML